jgi:DNA-binding transcriptional ArsR family regulator
MPDATVSESAAIKPKAQPEARSKAKSKSKSKARPEAKAKPQSRPAGAGEARKYRDAADLLKMVADPTRLRVLTLLADGEASVTELCTGIGTSQPGVSHHLALLRHANIIIPERRGHNNFYSLSDRGKLLADRVKGIVEL